MVLPHVMVKCMEVFIVFTSKILAPVVVAKGSVTAWYTFGSTQSIESTVAFLRWQHFWMVDSADADDGAAADDDRWRCMMIGDKWCLLFWILVTQSTCVRCLFAAALVRWLASWSHPFWGGMKAPELSKRKAIFTQAAVESLVPWQPKMDENGIFVRIK